MKRRIVLTVASILLTVTLFTAIRTNFAHAATLTVNSASDESDDFIGDNVCNTSVGTCTLRAALEEASPGDIINFNIPGCVGVCMIIPATAYPNVKSGVVIDGYTQPGSSSNTQLTNAGIDATLLVEINGSLTSGVSGLTLDGNNTIKGLVISNYATGIAAVGNDSHIQGNFIGTDDSGMVSKPNTIGVEVFGANTIVGGLTPQERNLISGNTDDGVKIMPAAADAKVLGNFVGLDKTGNGGIPGAQRGVHVFVNTTAVEIGGTTASARNVIACEIQQCIYIQSSSNSKIYGNYIGVNASGTAATFPNASQAGIHLIFNTSQVQVGNAAVPGSGNLISGLSHGVTITNDAHDNTIQSNYIGTDASGATAIQINTGISMGNKTHHNLIGGSTAAARNVIAGNGAGVGISMAFDANFNTIVGNLIGRNAANSGSLSFQFGVDILAGSDNQIGGINPGEANIIADTVGGANNHAIWIRSFISPQISHHNSIRGNSIYNSAGRGIALAAPVDNDNILPPTITSVAGTSVQGTVPGCPDCHIDIYSDNDDEGRVFEGTVDAIAGNWTFNAPAALTGPNITAVATDSLGNSSEFSAPFSFATPTFTVNTTDDTDDGLCSISHCSLREAMTRANNVPGADTITFNIPASDTGCSVANFNACKISVSSVLPNITEAVTIDGYSQPGSVKNTAPLGSTINSAIKIIVSGELIAAPGTDGFVINAGPSIIQGLSIGRFNRYGIITNVAGQLTLTGNYIGVAPDGLTKLQTNQCVTLYAPNSIVGGTAPEDRNLIGGSISEGIYVVSSATNTTILGNYIGTDKTGVNTNILHNAKAVTVDASDVIIGGPSNAGNYILGSAFHDLRLSSSGAIVTGNKFGGTLGITGALASILIDGHDNTIGGSAPGQANTISNTSFNGIRVSGVTAVHNNISQNSIFNNFANGIETINDGNIELMPPTILAATPTTASGTACGNCTIEVFTDLDDSGETYVTTVTADPLGNWTASGAFPLARKVTATATDQDGNTSEFSAPATVIAGSCAPSIDDIKPAPAPANLRFNNTESNDCLFLYPEKKDYVVPNSFQAVSVAVGEDALTTPTPVTINAQSHVDTYILHGDTLANNGGPGVHLKGRVTFDKPVLGVIWQTNALENTDANLGIQANANNPPPNLMYEKNNAGRGLENSTTAKDIVTMISPDTLEFELNFNAIDEIRIITGTNFATSCTATGPTDAVRLAPQPGDLRYNNYESDDCIFIFEEQTKNLPINLRITAPSTSNMINQLSPTVVLPAGTPVKSYIAHADNLANGGGTGIDLSGTYVFPKKVLGIIWTRNGLDITDRAARLGIPGVRYPTGFNGRNAEPASDEVTKITDFEYQIHFKLNALDQVRFITEQ